jgi:chaperonin GroES
MAKKTTEKKVYPRGKYVLVKQDEPETRESEFGILSPDSTEQEQKSRGVVEEVGNDIKDIKKGDTVIFGAYAGEEMKVKEGFKEVSYRLLYDDDIIAFLK